MTATATAPPDLREAPAGMTAGAAASSPAPKPMTSGTYLRMRREAAKLTIQHVVLYLVPPTRRHADAERADLRNRLALIEGDALVACARHELVDRLGPVFSFDQGIYWLLVGIEANPERKVPVPQICRGCACTGHDACSDDGQGCAWVAGDPTLCTACEKAGRGAIAPALETADAA